MFHVVILTADQVGGGILFQISDALSDAFHNSAKAILEDGRRGDQEEMLVFFDNRTVSPDFYDKYGEDAFDVLYFNEAAKDAATRAGIKLEIARIVDQPPEHPGLFTRMYRYVNLR